MICSLGWTFEQVDKLTLTQLNILYERWMEIPPVDESLVYVLAARFKYVPGSEHSERKRKSKPKKQKKLPPGVKPEAVLPDFGVPIVRGAPRRKFNDCPINIPSFDRDRPPRMPQPQKFAPPSPRILP